MPSNSKSFSRFPSRSFFYRNLPIQEALTTLRYGIEARKGLVLLIGEAGLGKSTLIQKTYRELGPNFIGAMTSNPRLEFTDILRLILRTLGTDGVGNNENELLRTCQFQLRARAQGQQSVALIFDNAHHLAASTLSRLVQTFIVAGPAHRDGHILQLVMAGRPQLRNNLRNAAHLPGAMELPIICELHPLEGFEIAGYIQAGLGASALPSELLDPTAIEAIGQFSHGNPYRINTICDRALQYCAANCDRKITADLIEVVAKDLEFRRLDSHKNISPSHASIDLPEEINPAEFELGERDTTEVVGETFLQYNQAYDASDSQDPAKRKSKFVGALALLIIVVFAGAWLRAGATVNPFVNWRDTLGEILLGHHQSEATVTAAAPLEPSPKLDAVASLPQPSVPTSTDEPSQSRGAPAIEELKTGGDMARGTADETLSPAAAPPAAHPLIGPKTAQRQPTRRNAPPRNDDIESAARQAIEMRAIDGVTVSVSDGTAILGGRVASEQQRRVAERAVRNVDGVKQVRNRIYIDYD